MESLLAQLDFLSALQNRHQLWANDVDNLEIAQLHREVIDSVERIRNQYNRLLDLYQRQDAEPVRSSTRTI